MSATSVPSQLSDLAGTPMTTLGDVIYAGAGAAITRLAGPTSSTKQFLTSTGTGTAANAPNWATIAAADYPTMVGDSGSGGTKGAVPAPASGDAAAGKYLKADGTWTTPPGGSASPGGLTTQVQVNDAGAFYGDANFTYAKATGTGTIKAFVIAAAGGATASPDLSFTNAVGINPTVTWNTTTNQRGVRFYSNNAGTFTEVLRLQDNGVAMATTLGTISGISITSNYVQSGTGALKHLFGSAANPAHQFTGDSSVAYSYLAEMDAPAATVPVLKVKGAASQSANLADFYVATTLKSSIDQNGNFTGLASNVSGTVAIANGGTGQTTATAALNALLPSQSTHAGQFLTTDGAGTVSWAAASGSGTVTSVNASGGTTGLTFSGGPVTTSGTLTLAGTLGTANGGTGLTSIGTQDQLLAVNHGATGLEYKTLVAGTGITIAAAAGSLTISASAGGGTVTSVGLAMPATFTVTGSPVTGSGTLTATYATQSANTIFAGPTTGAAATPAFRALVPADYPVFVASGASHAAGAVPDPGSVAGTTKFLREDATWAVPAGGGGSPGGSANSVQYNSAGTAFGGAANTSIGASGNLNLAAQAAPGTPTLGDLYNGSTQQALAAYLGASTANSVKQHLAGVIFTQTADGTVTNTTAETTLTASGTGTLTLPANYLVAGKTLRITARGYYSTAASAPGTITLKVKLGSVVVVATAAANFTASITNRHIAIEALITCRTTGASGTVAASGRFALGSSGTTEAILDAAQTGTSTIDTTASQAVDVTATCSTASASNVLTIQNLALEVLN